MRSPASRLDHGFSTLSSRGLGLHAVLRTADAASVAPKLAPLAADWPSLVLIGSAGTTLWQSMTAARAFRPLDPVDEYCEEALFDFCDDMGDDVGTRILWPDPVGDAPIAVTRLGELAGWSHRSPMGLGIHPRFGLWFAYRGVVLLDADIEELREPASASPCDSCADKPCIPACPPGAVGGPRGLELAPCLGERSRAGADCETRCLARAACPIGAEHRYSPEQMAHHQRFSTASLVLAVEHSASAPAEWSER
jgi:epoxyqueuosine reductase